ncbi:hypothetical protein QFC21_005463 [Naganishia friedmannii]|uniref:Uncharacterized protein n=1 Tax=Naganishia friedmannii TaxID=89922 RepID=A0ACC2V9E3_9TREE|nr:hypothetical protein QFC21_005463 [Naganishia friedmannii]
MDELREAAASSSIEESRTLSPSTSSASPPIPLPNFNIIPKILAKDLALDFLADFACKSAPLRDIPDVFKYSCNSVANCQKKSAIEWQKKQTKLDKEKLKAGLKMLEDPVAAKVEEQDRVRIFRQEQEIAIGIQLVSRSGGPRNRKSRKEPDSGIQLDLQGLIDIVKSEVGDNRKFYLNQSFCLKRHSDVFANPVKAGNIVLDEVHQDLSILQCPAISYTAVERQAMDFMSCLSSRSSESKSDTWTTSLGLSVATKQECGQPFSTAIRLYLMNRPNDSQQIENPIFDFNRFFPGKSASFWQGSPYQGVWSTLRIGMELDVYASSARLYQLPSQTSTIAQRRALLQHFYPNTEFVHAFSTGEAAGLIDLENFYSQLLPPPPQPPAALDSLQPVEMRTPLLPFQRRSVGWLLQREHASDLERTATYKSETWERLTIGFEAQGMDIAYSRLTGRALPVEVFPEWAMEGRGATTTAYDSFSRDKDEFGLSAVRGSMLCEEMGLGKTLEVIALVMLNKRKNDSKIPNVIFDETLDMGVTKVSATLIVTPETLVAQWKREIEQHAPTLKVMVYEGWKSLLERCEIYERGKRKLNPGVDEVSQYKELIDTWMQEVVEADIMLTTFGTVQMDWDVAPPPTKRARRSCATYVEKVRPLSALLLCHWHRVAIDEIQELDIASASKTANMVKTIKRDYSLAISGTPAKASVQDLASSLSFLGVRMPTHVWNRIVTPAYSKALHAIFCNIAIRHPKSSLSAEELTIPPQRRLLVPIKLSSIEWAYYKETYENNMDRLQRSQHGYTDSAMLRSVLHTLRMICTHLQVGLLGPNPNANGGRAVRLRLDHRIMPILDALQRMEEDAEATVLSRFAEVCRHQIRRALLIVLQDPTKWNLAVRIYEELYRDVTHQLTELETKVAGIPDDYGRTDTAAEDDEQHNERASPLNTLGLRRHTLRLLQHEIVFRLGDIFSSPEVDVEGRSQKEDQWYSTAGRIRSELLKSSAKSANDLRTRLEAVLRRSKVANFGELEIEEPDQLGLRGQRVQEPITIRIECLNDNAEMLWDARGKIVSALMETIDDTPSQADEAGGKDYQQTLQEQHELEAYMWIYQCALADRTEFMVEERSALAVQADRAEAIRQAEAEDQVAEEQAAGTDQEIDIREKLMEQRNAIRHAAQKGMSLKAAYIELNGIRANAFNRPEEDAICRMEVDRLKDVIKTQTQIIKRLTDEFAVMNNCFNRRVAHYRALQAISDTVGEVELETDDVAQDLVTANSRVVAAQAAYDRVNARRRYSFLAFLRQLQSVRVESTEDICPICCEQLGDGAAANAVILACLHRLCAPCYRELCFNFDKPVCPTCRRRVEMDDDVQNITYKPVQPQGVLGEIIAEDAESGSLQATLDLSEYNIASEDPEMLSVHVKGSWGSKLDRLIRQLQYWRRTQPDVKHIIFSSWKDALTIVEAALNDNGISWRSRSAKKGDTSIQEFTEDPDILVFLLHGERENSGLTLTAASVCHLLEPVINSGFELQAIGRVDRLGQMKETTVYSYATLDTVETKIVNRAKANHTSLYAKDEAESSKRGTVMASTARKGADDLSGSRDDILDLLLA